MPTAEDKTKSALQKVVVFFWNVLKPVLQVVHDDDARKETLTAMGLNTTTLVYTPKDTSGAEGKIQNFIDKPDTEANIESFFTAVEGLYFITAAVSELFELANPNDGDQKLAGSQMTSAFLNLMALNYFRNTSPYLHTIALMLMNIDEKSSKTGEIVTLFEQIGKFFEAILLKGFGKVEDSGLTPAQILEQEQYNAHALSDVILLLTSVGLMVADSLLDDVDVALSYGFDAPQGSPNPNKDGIAARTLSFAVKTDVTGNAQQKTTATINFVPKWQGGVAVVTDLNGALKLQTDFAKVGKASIEFGGGGVFRIGESPSAEGSGAGFGTVEFKRDTDKPVKVNVFEKTVLMVLGYAKAGVKLMIKEDEVDIKFKTDIPFELNHSKDAGFPFTLIPHIDQTFNLALGVSSKRGLYLEGGGNKLIVTIPLYKQLGPFDFRIITIILDSKEGTPPTKTLEISIDFTIKLGSVLQATFIRVGLLTTLAKNGDGFLDYKLSPDFKPPNGAGIVVDAVAVKGGGFLYFDNEKGEYGGAIELSFKGIFTLKAIGLINTIMPDGSKGFSLLIIITAEFIPIQLGFGFMLSGVGGLLGLNRTMNEDALVKGVKTNAVQSVLFPKDVVGNIAQIISDIKQFFPPQPDSFIVGLMAKIEWGRYIDIELGFLLQLPNPVIAILGIIKATLPDKEAPLLRLQVNFLGLIDFQHGFVFFRADLYDSRLLIFTLTGSFAFAISWGDAKLFALSSGGFHPDFRDYPVIPQIPDGFRNMDRLGISLLSEDNPRLKVESYFAVTSNTVQFGSRAELYAEAAGFNVYGYMGFDALFQFDPFRFIVKIEAGLALRRGSTTLMGITVSVSLAGPKPWDLNGEASFTFLFFDITIPFHVTWGDPAPAVLKESEDLMKIMQAELQDVRNWKADIPSNSQLHVTVKTIQQAPDALTIHPFGLLTFSQRSLPLADFNIQKYGNKKPQDAHQFHLSKATSGATALTADFVNVKELFAPNNFIALTDSEKLSRKSFEEQSAGFKLSGGSALRTTAPVVKEVTYRMSYLHRKRLILTISVLYKMAVSAYKYVVRGSAVRNSTLSYQNNRPSLNAPAEIVINTEQYAIANTSDLQLHDANDLLIMGSQALAFQKYTELIDAKPDLAGKIQVVSHYELNKA